jgi:hypothetical protein
MLSNYINICEELSTLDDNYGAGGRIAGSSPGDREQGNEPALHGSVAEDRE